jgi:HSP20 family protein
MNTIKYIVPSATLSETPEAFELKFTVPGIGKGDIDLHIEGKTLTLKTHAKREVPEGFKVAAEEFERMNYAMSVEIPEMADTASLSAKIENGILKVGMKKRPETQPKKIEVL